MKHRKKPTFVNKDAGETSEVLSQVETDLEVSIGVHGAEKTAWDIHQILTAQQADTKAYMNGIKVHTQHSDLAYGLS